MTTKCPHCFNDLPPTRFAFLCKGSCPEQVDPAFSRWQGGEARRRTVMDVALAPDRRDQALPAPPPCRQCGGETVECCPVCHYALAEGWRRRDTTCIALAGSRSSGKSVFIGVLLQFVHVFLEAQPQSVLTMDAANTKRFEDTYKNALDDARRLPGTMPIAQADAPQREPLVMTGEVMGRPHALVFRDVAGEDLEKPGSDNGALGFYANASAVFFLFDPTAVKQIRQQLSMRLRLPPAGADPEPVLEYVTHTLMQGRGNLAVIMSKFDILHQLAPTFDAAPAEETAATGPRVAALLEDAMNSPGVGFRRDPGPRAAFGDDDSWLVSEEVRSLLMRINPSGIVSRLETHSAAGINRRYFAVSALGAQPEGDQLSASGITPFRVMDPLRWALAGAPPA